VTCGIPPLGGGLTADNRPIIYLSDKYSFILYLTFTFFWVEKRTIIAVYLQ